MMRRSGEEFEGCPSRLSLEGPFLPLNLPLTTTPEFIKSIESILQREYPCPHQPNSPYMTENTKTLTPPETPKSTEKPKALNIQMSKITIGEWSYNRLYPDDLKAKFYFAKKKLMWEILDNVTGTQVSRLKRLKRKIELKWSDVLSFRATSDTRDETETLEIELGKCPTFFVETPPQAGKHTQWEETGDFTTDHSASICRRHKLQFFPGDLQKTLEKLVSADSFWSKLAKVNFPTQPDSLYFDIGYGNNNDYDSSNLSPYGNYQATQFGGSQAYAQETQTNSVIFQHSNDDAISQIGPYASDFLTQGEIQILDACFQTDNICL